MHMSVWVIAVCVLVCEMSAHACVCACVSAATQKNELCEYSVHFRPHL